ncbi:MAG: addiction module protein [Saprospiraceae bacterium]|nr:addiction module protein [Saprospiraceae bacterium]
MTVQLLKEEVSKLSKLQQAELMHYLVELLTAEEFVLSEEWKGEIDRREQALNDGTSIGRPAKDVLTKYKSE